MMARHLLAFLLAALSATALPSEAFAQQSATEIFEQAQKTQKIENSIQSLRMVLIGRNGAERVRELEMRVRRDEDVLKSYTRFRSPSDVAGTQLVLVDNPDKLDEQLLYLPALRRVQRIAGRARTGSFMGSDFTYEDLEISNARNATHEIVDETDEIWIVETNPGEDTSYGRIRTHVHKVDFLPRKVEYFDKRNQPLKELTVEKIDNDGERTIPTVSVMKNLQRGTATRLEIINHQLGVNAEEIPDETFTQAFMERNG